MNDQSQMMNQHQMAPQMMGNQMVNPGQMMPQSYASQWSQPPVPPHTLSMPPPPPPVPMNPLKFPNPMYAPGLSKPGRTANNWKGKKPMDKRKDSRRKDNLNMNMIMNNMNNMNNNNNMNSMNMNMNNNGGVVAGAGGVYQPPTLYELEQQNRLKARRFYHPKKKFNRMGPYAHAPRNTTSYIIRAKKAGGIASMVSPCPVTPAVLPTPVFSPSREALVDMAKEEWGVDGYGSMKGLIRLRSPGHDETVDDYDEEEEDGSSESDVEEHVEVERRLDHDLSRFEMIYPNSGVDYHNVLENRVDDQDTHIAQLEEENLILKERLYLMEREFGELRRRLLSLERQNQVVEDINEEVVENVSENDSEGFRNSPLRVNRDNGEVDFVPRDGVRETGERRSNSDETLHKELKELTVEEVSPDDGLGFGTTAVNKVGEDVEVLAAEACEKPSELSESVMNKDLGSVDGTKVNSVDESVKGQPVGDVYMGEIVPDTVNENDRLANVANNGSGVMLKKEVENMVFNAQAEKSSNTIDNEVTGDVCMGDMISADKAVEDDETNA
ncbi:uncharacterized protein LOC141657898 isoform X2 [Silene latifolia]|uniref:uncharacterized protein LOC141657898 isoform X2 n=1 Tax=Silene latifolia TaxID=37657 RepID=UPI003D77F42D